QAHCPDSSGNPTIAKAVTVQNAIPNPLPVPQATFTYGTFPCTINVSSGVTTAQAQATLSGFLNDLEGIDDPLALLKSVSVNVVSPDFNVTKTCSFTDPNAVPGTITTVSIAGSVSNTGSENLSGLQCSDSNAGPVVLSGTSIPVGGSVTYSGSFTT